MLDHGIAGEPIRKSYTRGLDFTRWASKLLFWEKQFEEGEEIVAILSNIPKDWVGWETSVQL